MATLDTVDNGSKEVKATSRLRECLTVDVRMIPAKISFLLYGGLLGSHVPFLNVFFVSVGLSTSESGFINGIRFLPSAIAGPLWGMMADYSGKRKLVLVLLCIGAAVPLFSMPWVSSAIHPVSNNITCHTQQNITVAKENILFTSTVTSTANCFDTKEKMAINVLFYVLLSIMMFGSIFVGPLPGYVDSIVMNLVKTGRSESTYGAQRIFGSFGFSLATFVSGVAADHYKVPHMSRYTAVFCIYLPYTLLLIPFGCYMVGQARWENTDDDDDHTKDEAIPKNKTVNKSMTSQLASLFGQFDVLFFMSTALVSGLACNIFQNFTLLLVNDVMKASETEMSLVFVVATIAEVILFPFTSKLMKFLGGTSIAITVGIFSYFVRFLVMSYTNQLWLMLLVQTLHAFGFALTWAAMMEYLHDASPKEIFLTVFLVFQSIHFGVASLLANVAGGFLYQSYGGKLLFRGKAIVCGVWTALMVVYYGCKYAKSKYRHKGYIIIEN